MPIEDSLNEKNKALYDLLTNAGVKITHDVDKTAEMWYVRSQTTYQIGSPNDTPNPAALAHELLHIQLLYKGFWDHFSIYKYYNEANSLLNFDEIAILNNNLAHFKMIDEFLAMGFHVDEFLHDTPKKYYIEGIVYQIPKIILLHKAGTKLCEQAIEIVQLVAALKLFELYKQKDPETKQAIHVPTIIEELKREIDKDLIEGLETLFDDWIAANTVDNFQFYNRLDIFLKNQGFTNIADCQASSVL